MSISIALGNALSGLTATARGIEVVSSNVSNAQTPGYGRRELELSARVTGTTGSGVWIDGVKRMVDPGILREMRLADSTVAGDDQRLSFFSDLDSLIGASAGPNALSEGVARFHATLVEATASPDSSARLSAAFDAANDVTRQLNDASDHIQTARMEADRDIGDMVTRLNADLQHVVDLNVQIRKVSAMGRDANALVDQRQRVIDGIAEIVPLREVPRDDGMVALYTTGGASLVEGKAAAFSFSPVAMITPDMTIESGALSKLSMNGREITTANDGGFIGGGRLGALFQVRDELAVEAQATLDSVARDLVDRFADPAVDPTIGVTDAGLFTDAGVAFDPADEVGLAGRIALNAAVDPDQGGAFWHLRAGLYAAVPNDAGDSTVLASMADALTAGHAPASGPFAGIARSAGALAGEMSAGWTGQATQLERTLTYHQSRADSLRELHLQDGVDTDQEMERLLVLEQSYAANARVISTVDQLLQMLMEL